MCLKCGQLTLNKKGKNNIKLKLFSGVELSNDIRTVFGIHPKSMIFFRDML